MDRNGSEWIGEERNGFSGLGWNGLAGGGAERIGEEWIGQERNGLLSKEGNGKERSGLDRNGMVFLVSHPQHYPIHKTYKPL